MDEPKAAPASEAGAESVRADPVADPAAAGSGRSTVSAAGEGAAAPGGGRGSAERAEEPDQRAAAERRAEEYLAQLQRLKADFDNYRRRMMQEQVRWQEQAVGRFVAQLLPVLDNLERALLAGEGAGVDALRQGLEMTLRQFRDVLAREGVTPIEAVGRPFDPACHEAMMRVEGGEREEDTVVEEFQKGYLYKGAVLRPALVKVAVAGPRAADPPDAAGAAGEAAGADTV